MSTPPDDLRDAATRPIAPGGRLSLGQMADALVGVESTANLLARLEQLLEPVDALPARLYLVDDRAMALYCATAIGDADTDVPELPVDEVLLEPAKGCLPLFQHGDPVGMLEVLGPAEGAWDELAQLAVLLGPALIAVHHQELSLRELRTVHQRVNRLTAAGRLLRHMDHEVLLVEILQAVLEAVSGQVGALLVADPAGKLVPAVAWGLRDDHLAAIRVRASGQPVAEHLFATGAGLRLAEEDLGEVLDLGDLDGELTGLIGIVLTSAERRHGVVLLVNPGGRFTAEDERLAGMVCDMAAIALDNTSLVRAMVDRERMQHDFQVARQVQAKMLPALGMGVGPVAVDGLSRPSEETGGDYFTFLERGGELLAMIGDVTGHGLGAALFTTVAHAILHHELRREGSLAASMESLNRSLYSTQSGRFMTAALVAIDPASGRMRYVSAGHNPLLLLRQGQVTWLESTGMPLGILADNEVPEAPAVDLAPGDILLLYTDGYTEAEAGVNEFLGEEGLVTALLAATASAREPKAILDHLLGHLVAFAGSDSFADDVTLVAVTIAPDAVFAPRR